MSKVTHTRRSKTTFLSLVISVLLISETMQTNAAEVMTIAAIDSVTVRVPELVMQEAYRRLGIQIKIVKLPPARSLLSANAGIYDAELGRVNVDHNLYNNLIRVPVEIDRIEGTVFTKNKVFEVAGWESLRPYAIGIRNGVKFSERGTKGMNVVAVSENVQLLRMLDIGRIDIAVMNKYNGLKAIKALKLQGIKGLEPPVHRLNVYHYLHLKRSNLLPALTATLKKMAADGEIDKIAAEARGE